MVFYSRPHHYNTPPKSSRPYVPPPPLTPEQERIQQRQRQIDDYDQHKMLKKAGIVVFAFFTLLFLLFTFGSWMSFYDCTKQPRCDDSVFGPVAVTIFLLGFISSLIYSIMYKVPPIPPENVPIANIPTNNITTTEDEGSHTEDEGSH